MVVPGVLSTRGRQPCPQIPHPGGAGGRGSCRGPLRLRHAAHAGLFDLAVRADGAGHASTQVVARHRGARVRGDPARARALDVRPAAFRSASPRPRSARPPGDRGRRDPADDPDRLPLRLRLRGPDRRSTPGSRSTRSPAASSTAPSSRRSCSSSPLAGGSPDGRCPSSAGRWSPRWRCSGTRAHSGTSTTSSCLSSPAHQGDAWDLEAVGGLVLAEGLVGHASGLPPPHPEAAPGGASRPGPPGRLSAATTRRTTAPRNGTSTSVTSTSSNPPPRAPARDWLGRRARADPACPAAGRSRRAARRERRAWRRARGCARASPIPRPTARPPGRRTRWISAAPRSGSGTSIRPSRQSTASYEASGSSIVLEVELERGHVAEATVVGPLRCDRRHLGCDVREDDLASPADQLRGNDPQCRRARRPSSSTRSPGWSARRSSSISAVIGSPAVDVVGVLLPARRHRAPHRCRPPSQLVQVHCRGLLCLLSALHDQISLFGWSN